MDSAFVIGSRGTGLETWRGRDFSIFDLPQIWQKPDLAEKPVFPTIIELQDMP